MERPVEILARRIADRIAQLGINDYTASMEAVGQADMVRDINRGKMPSAVRLAKLAAALQTSTEWLLGLKDDEPAADTVAAAPRNFKAEPAVIGQRFDPQPAPHGNARDFPKDIPVLGNALGSSTNFSNGTPTAMELIEMGEPVDMVRRPPGLAQVKGAYALYIMGDSQSPRFEPGELIYVNPHRPAAPGDDVVVQLIDEEGCTNCALVKRMVRRTADAVILRQFNPPLEFPVPLARIKPKGIHRIMTSAELYGY